MFAQQAKDKAAASAGTGYQQKDLSEVTCNNCNEKGHYQRSPSCPVQKKLMDNAEKYRATQKSSGSKSKGKQLLMHGVVDDDYDYDYSEPHLMFCQTSKVVDNKQNCRPHGATRRQVEAQECIRAQQQKIYDPYELVLQSIEPGIGTNQ